LKADIKVNDCFPERQHLGVSTHRSIAYHWAMGGGDRVAWPPERRGVASRCPLRTSARGRRYAAKSDARARPDDFAAAAALRW